MLLLLHTEEKIFHNLFFYINVYFWSWPSIVGVYTIIYYEVQEVCHNNVSTWSLQLGIDLFQIYSFF